MPVSARAFCTGRQRNEPANLREQQCLLVNIAEGRYDSSVYKPKYEKKDTVRNTMRQSSDLRLFLWQICSRLDASQRNRRLVECFQDSPETSFFRWLQSPSGTFRANFLPIYMPMQFSENMRQELFFQYFAKPCFFSNAVQRSRSSVLRVMVEVTATVVLLRIGTCSPQCIYLNMLLYSDLLMPSTAFTLNHQEKWQRPNSTQ